MSWLTMRSYHGLRGLLGLDWIGWVLVYAFLHDCPPPWARDNRVTENEAFIDVVRKLYAGSTEDLLRLDRGSLDAV